jgi:hypothetical protein
VVAADHRSEEGADFGAGQVVAVTAHLLPLAGVIAVLRVVEGQIHEVMERYCAALLDLGDDDVL